jgi:RNA recognition motif-containing protein
MSSGNVLDQTSTTTTGSSSTTSNNPTNSNNTNPNNNNTVNNNSTVFQAVRNNPENMGHSFENSMQMFAMKQPMTSPVTGTIYTGPPAKYLSNGGMNSNGYAASGPMRQMIPPQQQNRYGSYNGNNNNNNNSGSAMQQQRRQNNSGVDNATNDSVNTRKVFVGGLSPDTKMEHLCEYFAKFGNVESATVKFDKSGRSKGFGFVLFEDRDSTDKVYSQDLHVIQGKRVDTKSAHRRDQALARKVFVGGLDTEVSDAELRDYFSQYGKIAQIEAPVDKIKQKRRPFCFVLFENEQSAEEVLKQPRHTLAGKAIDCKRANPKTTENNQQNNNVNNPMQAPLAHYNMPGLAQNPFQYQQQPRSQQPSSHQQLQYQQAALAAQQPHYPFYNSSSINMSSAQQHQPTNQQGQNRSQSNRQQLASNNQGLAQPWSPLSPAQWPNTNYADPRSYGSYGPSSASGSNAAWQVGPPQGNTYGQGRTPSSGPSGNPVNTAVGPPQTQPQFGGANSNSAQYPYAGWGFSQPQGSQGPPSAGPPPNQYNYGADSSNGPPNAFAYQPPTGYDHFSSDSAHPSNYSR